MVIDHCSYDFITISSLNRNFDILTAILTFDPPLKKRRFLGGKIQKKIAPHKKFVAPMHIKNTFCKKIGPNRPLEPSAVANIIYTRLYGVATTN